MSTTINSIPTTKKLSKSTITKLNRKPAIHTIWQNYDLRDMKKNFMEFPDEWGYTEADIQDKSDYEINKLVENCNWEYLDCDRINLDIPTEGRIIAIASIQFWNGIRNGYKLYGHNIQDCLSLYKDCEYGEFFIDRYNFKSHQSHHDGTNTLVFREIRPEMSSDQIDNFLWKITRNKDIRKDVTRYTRSLRGPICDVYGW